MPTCRHPGSLQHHRSTVPLVLGLIAISHSLSAVEAITVTTTSLLRSDVKAPIGTNFVLLDADAARPGRVSNLVDALGPNSGLGLHAKFLRWNTMNYLWTTKSASSALPIAYTDTVPSPLTPLVSPVDLSWMLAAGACNASSRPINSVDFNGFLAMCQQVGAEPVVVVPSGTVYEVTGNSASVTLAQMIEATRAQIHYANAVQTIGPKVKYWEVGNETYQVQTIGAYVPQLQAFSTAMRAEDPTISIGAVGYTAAWDTTLVSSAASSFDFIVEHQYPYYNFTGGYATYAASAAFNLSAQPALQAIAAAPVVADRTRLKVMVNEFNANDWLNSWPSNNDQGHAVAAFDLAGQLLRAPQNIAALEWGTRWIGSVSYHPGTTFNGVTNGTFSSGLTSWTGTNGSVVGGQLTSNGSVAMSRNQTVAALTPGKAYTLTFTASDSTPANWSAASLYFYNASGVQVGAAVSAVLNATASKAYEQVFTVPAGTATTYLNLYAASKSVVKYDNVVISDKVIPNVFDALDPLNRVNPVGRAVALLGQFYQGSLVATTETTKVHSYASLNPTTGALVVWLVNRPTTPSTASLSLGSYVPQGTTCQRWTFSGTGPTDPAPTWTSTPSTIALSSLSSLSLPAVSVTVLQFAKAP